MENLNLMVFENNEVEVIMIDDVVYFELYSVGMALGYANKRKAKGKEYVSPYKSRIEKVVENAEITGLCHDGTTYLSEEDLYDFILESKTEKGRAFRKWVTHEVLPTIRKAGCYIGESATDESISFQAKFGNRRLRRTIQESDDLRGLFEEYMELSLIERKAKRINNQDRINACKIFSDEIGNKIVNEARTMRGSELLALQELLTDIADAKLELSNRLNGGKKSAQTKKINKLEEELNKEDNLDDYFVIDMHSWSVNYMYDNRGGVKVKTKGYGAWRQNMYFQLSRTLPKEYPDVDFTQPIRLSLGFVALEKFDVDNLCKGVQDAISKDFYGFDDNLIWEVRAKRIDTCSTYEDGKIYIKIENIQ